MLWGGTQKGSREGEARRSKHRKERVKRATEEHSKEREPSRLGLWRSSSQQHQSLINSRQQHCDPCDKWPHSRRTTRTPATDQEASAILRLIQSRNPGDVTRRLFCTESLSSHSSDRSSDGKAERPHDRRSNDASEDGVSDEP